jgi:hypothetical protein
VKKSIYFTAMFVLTECIITMAIVRNCSRKGFYFSLVRFWKIAMMLNASCYAIFFLFAKPRKVEDFAQSLPKLAFYFTMRSSERKKNVFIFIFGRLMPLFFLFY